MNRIIVLGMPRSGTSLIADLVRQWGALLGEAHELPRADEHNPRGYWEYLPLRSFNNDLLTSVGANKFVPPDDTAVEALRECADNPNYRDRAISLIETMDQRSIGRAWCWKDPRLPILMPFWSRILQDKVAYIIPIRNPLAIASSQQAFANIPFPVHPFPISMPLIYWQRNMLDILYYTEHHQRKIFVEYEQFIKQPQETCDRLCVFLNNVAGQNVDSADRIAAMVQVIDPALQRQKSLQSLETVPQATDEQRALYTLLKARVHNANHPAYIPGEVRLYAGWHDYLRCVAALYSLAMSHGHATAR